MPQTRRLAEGQPPSQLLVLRQAFALMQLRDTPPQPSLLLARACNRNRIGINLCTPSGCNAGAHARVSMYAHSVESNQYSVLATWLTNASSQCPWS